MSYTHYTPIDEVLSKPSTQLLRALRHFDWATTRDLMIACGIEFNQRETDHNTMSVSLSRLARAGYVESTPQRMNRLYRITAKGRAELKRRLTVEGRAA